MTRVKLTERVETGKFWKSPRAKEKVIVAAFNPYEGKNLFDLREHVIGADGVMRPSPRGIAMVVEKLPELHAAIGKALKRARGLGLLDPDSNFTPSDSGASEPEGCFVPCGEIAK
jgi:Transcriptional Coactivator p15 (PC4)